MALRQQGRVDEATASFRQAYRLSGDPGLEVKMALALPIIPESASPHRRDARADAGPGDGPDRARHPPGRPAGPGRPDLLLSGLPRRRRPARSSAPSPGMYESACPDLTQDLADPAPRTDGRVHVGFVSQYWHQHTIAKLNLGLIRTLDRRPLPRHPVHHPPCRRRHARRPGGRLPTASSNCRSSWQPPAAGSRPSGSTRCTTPTSACRR